MDAVARYRAASEGNDIDALMETLAPDAELVSPLSGLMVFRGRNDLRILLSAVYGSLRGWRWTEVLGDGPVRAMVGEGSVGPLRLGDAMVVELSPEDRIRRMRPHLRPWLALTFFALKVGPKVARHPGVIWRALRSA